ncbi:TonB-dependent copper receptor [Idiomarina aquatica]|uniref:TonB-dependent copper receptor n=1 Tax=Idiomarina aquatica TaxID=1327752 RepID=A0AA94JEC3_9GAMM|nr:TonB-dependent copper receptor [Idiomarina aquatica]RUO45573.1 TonB-dependent copper receptor [Idiomarina aquatica]
MHKGYLSLALLYSVPLFAQEKLSNTDEYITIIGESMLAPGVYEVDAKQPRQPLPAHDGGDFLKTIAGFSASRKGGASADPLFRGMGASRLTIVNDGQMLQGGCSNRMDPPTAYISPQSYDTIRIVKGPQTVRYAGSAAIIEFEREALAFSQPTFEGFLNLTGASYDRANASSELIAGNANGYLKANLTTATAGDYEDGNGVALNSEYQRWSSDIDVAWTPSQDHTLTLSLGASDGEAAYADRAMDGVKFARRSTAIRYEVSGDKQLRSATVAAYFNHIDHVMDNYSLREFRPSMMMPQATARNPDRYARGARIESEWQLAGAQITRLGAEYHQNVHRDRISRNQLDMPYQNMPRQPDADTSQFGVFAEQRIPLPAAYSINAGWRWDQWRLTDRRQVIGTMMTSQNNPTVDQVNADDLFSGFIRLEQQLDSGYWYAGWGQAERFPDYWETIGNNRSYLGSPSALFLKPETNQQWDIGWHYNHSSLQLDASLFFANIADFILLEEGAAMMPDVVRNVDARSWGGEATGRWQVSQAWKLSATVAITRGKNKTDDQYLPQQPADELRIASEYQHSDLTYALVWRLVKQQDRVDIGSGNVIGYDFASTSGYGIVSANISWAIDKDWQLAVGVDNLFDKVYAEHVSGSGATIAGYQQTERVNEPGRVLWLQSNVYF